MNLTQAVMQKIYSDTKASELLLEMSVRGKDTFEIYQEAFGVSATEFGHVLHRLQDCGLVQEYHPAIDPTAPLEQRINIHYLELTITGKFYADLLREIQSAKVTLAERYGFSDKLLQRLDEDVPTD